MTKTTTTKSGKVIATYAITATKRDLDEIISDVLKIYSGKKITITVAP